ncbi:hypothetical protein BU17DRAFT_64919 [Hysterangium stoloniferum]|nr:hypothetical protein BU17DRAFT_64919 [Hysterangium stoloniferum]
MSQGANGTASATPNGVVDQNPGEYTNIIKLARMVSHLDPRSPNKVSIPQVVFYQSGIGTEQPLVLEYLQGATGSSLREKVQEAYGFICHNYHPGDEIFLFGFSRGAYTARMLAFFIGKLGVLDKKDLIHFADIFDWMQDLEHPDKQGKDERERLEAANKKFEPVVEAGRKRADPDGNDFTITVLGVFDTVGSLGLPQELHLFPKMKHFGLSDQLLGKHVEHAYHAIAINETRLDFDVVRFEQSEEGLQKNQTLKQVWFSGAHSDANVMDKLALDIQYMESMFEPTGPWGTQQPHDPATGVFQLSLQTKRTLPKLSPPSPSFPYFESIHPSVQSQPEDQIVPALKELISANPQIVCDLTPFEEEIKSKWAEKVAAQGKEGCEENRRKAEEADSKARKEGVKGTLVGIKNVFVGVVTGLVRKVTSTGKQQEKK